MKKIKRDGTERDWYLVKEWVTKAGILARIHQGVWSDKVKKIAPSLHDYFTGYVQVPIGQVINEDIIDVHGGVTFSKGELIGARGEWVGFDMGHACDENLQNIEYAEQECEKLAEQIK